MGAMVDTCCGKCIDRCECIYETIPSVTILGVVFALVGYILTLDCAPAIVSSFRRLSLSNYTGNTHTKNILQVDMLEFFGLDATKFGLEAELLALMILCADAAVLLVALFSTGWCRKKLFHESTKSTGYCMQVCFGPICQVILFVVIVVCMAFSAFLLVTSSMTWTLSKVSNGVCDGPYEYVVFERGVRVISLKITLEQHTVTLLLEQTPRLQFKSESSGLRLL